MFRTLLMNWLINAAWPLTGNHSNMVAINLLTHGGDSVGRDKRSSLGVIQRWEPGGPGLSKDFSNRCVFPWEFTLVGTKKQGVCDTCCIIVEFVLVIAQIIKS